VSIRARTGTRYTRNLSFWRRCGSYFGRIVRPEGMVRATTWFLVVDRSERRVEGPCRAGGAGVLHAGTSRCVAAGHGERQRTTPFPRALFLARSSTPSFSISTPEKSTFPHPAPSRFEFSCDRARNFQRRVCIIVFFRTNVSRSNLHIDTVICVGGSLH